MKKQTDIYLFTNGFGRFGVFQKRTEKKIENFTCAPQVSKQYM